MPRDADLLPLIALGGAIGSAARWGLGEALPGDGLAWGTLSANVLGSMLLGALLTVVLERAPQARRVRAFAGVGLLGGFTTFSTAMLDTHGLVADARLPLAMLEVGVGLTASLLAVVAGVLVTRRLLGAETR